MLNNIKGGVSPLQQKKSTTSAHGQLNDAKRDLDQDKAKKYWYKINGKTVTKAQYLAYKNKPGGDEKGKQTNHPDVYGRKKGGSVSKPK
tara:strand:- start:476 stop:742 length:267 start_codon:yes stop_codon:yes gene_type:complete